MIFTIKYKNGTIITEHVITAMIDDDTLVYITKKQVHGIVREPVRIPLKNIEHMLMGEEEK